MSTTFNTVDLIFIAFTLIFVVTAFFRGFVKEMFSLTGWLLAFAGSYFLTPFVAKFFNSYSHNQLVADISARSIIFILILLAFAFSTSNLCSDLRDKMPQAFDRSLGVLYGLIKTLIVFGFLYAVAANALGFLSGKPVEESSSQFPSFLKEAKCHDILKGSADILNPAVKLFFDEVVKNLDRVVPKEKDEIGKKIEELTGKAINDSVSESRESEVGYEKKDIEKMNHLIDIIDKK